MMELTESAVSAIRTAISGSPEAVEGLRIMVESGGCAGNKYMMGLVTDSQPGDVVVEKGGVKVFIDVNRVQLSPDPAFG